MRHIPIFLLLSIFSFTVSAQNVISGVVNRYSSVSLFECDSTLLTVDPVQNFQAGDKVLLIQMQGALCNLSNTPLFGDINNLNSAGHFEFNRVHSIVGDKVQLQYKPTHSYEVDGKVQLVFVPEYSQVTASGLTALPWDGNIGGVMAIDVSETLTIDGESTVDALGFRGGIAIDGNGSSAINGETNYFYDFDPNFSGQKGEGIAIIPSNKMYGKGKAVNGGGGGNAHNAGGGGGGNGGSGGDGGREYYSLPGSPVNGTKGLGGIAVLNASPDRIFFGGGGGAGQMNDFVGASGGNGGGIIIIKAHQINAENNALLTAKGATTVAPTENSNNDGQGGGGGGGTILISATSITGDLRLVADGGKGADCLFYVPEQIIGPGGGGGGGRILLSQNFGTVINSVLGGANGIANQNLTNSAMPGQPGLVETNAEIPESDHLAWILQPFGAQIEAPTCMDPNSGSIILPTAPGFTYSINNSPFTQNGTFTSLSNNSYTIRVRYNDLCEKDTIIIFSIQTPGSTSEIASCLGYSIDINNIVFTQDTTIIFTYPLAGGCDSIVTFHLSFAPPVYIEREFTLCPGQSIIIDDIAYDMPAVIVDTLFSSGVYSEGCDTIRTTNILLDPAYGNFLSPDTNICEGEVIRLYSEYPETVWSNGFVGSSIDISTTGNYWAGIISPGGCHLNDTVKVISCCFDRGLYIPNAFTPDNNDNINDIFKPFATPACSDFRFQVWSRWGALIFESDNPDDGWDGTVRGKPAPVDVYVWVLEFTPRESGKRLIRKGDVTLIR